MAFYRMSSRPAECLFECLQWLYPSAFRDEYAAEMRAVLRRRWRDEAAVRGTAGMALFGAGIIWDTIRTACEEHAFMLLQDLKFIFRTLARSPLFAAAAILTIALGIGADTAIFSIVDHVLLRPLPFSQSERLLIVRLSHPTEHDVSLSVADFLDWRSQNRIFQSVSAYHNDLFSLSGVGDPIVILGASVTDGFFSTLRVQAFLGRTFKQGDDAPGQQRKIVLSYQLWRTRFHGDSTVTGRVILLDSQPYTVIGVMNTGFAFPSRQDLLWAIQPIEPQARRGPYFLTGIARMKDGMTIRAAVARLGASIYPTVGVSHQSDRKPIQFYVQPLREAVVGKFRKSLIVLLGAVTLVLLIACVNVVNLLLGRSAAREREIVLRISLGANARQLLRQFLTESLVISVLGASLGVVIAFASLQWYRSFAPDLAPQFGPVDIDGRVLLFTAASVLASGLLIGLAPALRATRLQMSQALRSGRNTSSQKQERARILLILSEVALACMLVTSAGLLIRSYVRLSNVESGTRADHLMTFLLSLPSRRYPPPAAVEQFYERLLDRIRQIPGVEATGAGSGLPPDQLAFSDEYTFEERPLAPHEPVPVAPVVIVTPDYFRAVGIAILRGRAFTERDTTDRTPVAIISHAMAQKYFLGEDPVGKRIRQGGPERQNPWMEIVGVAADAKYTGLEAADRPAYYKPEAQSFMGSMYVAVRTGVAPKSIVPALRSAVASLDKDLALDRVQTMQQNLAASISRPRLQTSLLAILAGLGLGLAGIGVYGVVAYSVARRTSELGIRGALGATRRDLLGLVIRDGMRPVLAGLILGVLGTLSLGRVARSLLFETAPQDPLTLLLSVVVLGAVGLLACLLPALRATRIDPATALRVE
ncbi:MAG: ABC transporter permease [Bryobacteraceae bacterium]